MVLDEFSTSGYSLPSCKILIDSTNVDLWRKQGGSGSVAVLLNKIVYKSKGVGGQSKGLVSLAKGLFLVL